MVGIEEFDKKLVEIGYKAAITPIGHVKDLEGELSETASEDLKQRYLAGGFDYGILERHPDLKSLIIVASPSPQTTICFTHKGVRKPVLLPPIYADRYDILERVIRISGKIFGEAGYRCVPVSLPKKPLAVHSGLARYGRNNLAYVEGMGSFMRLTAFASDMPCGNDSWGELKIMDSCRNCTLCRRNCPVKAIPDDRFLLHVERCLTFYNEKTYPFPEWMPDTAHHCLVGCMKCQECCPNNRVYLDGTVYHDGFSEEETQMILDEAPFSGLPGSVAGKLEELALAHYYPVLSRNLKLILR